KIEKKSNTFDNYIPYFFKGIWYTIVITIFSVIIGIVLGIILALMRLSKNPILHWLAVGYIEFIRGTPQMVQILFVYFGIGYLISNLSALVAGIIAIGLILEPMWLKILDQELILYQKVKWKPLAHSA